MRVRIYRNLSPQYRDRRVWSVVALEGPRKGLVIDRVEGAILRDASFVVSEAGRQRVLREKAKNVHAFIRGELVETFPLNSLSKKADGEEIAPGSGATVPVSYNPYKAGHFFRLDNGEAVGAASLVAVAPQGVYAAKPTALRGLFGLGAARTVSADWSHAPVTGWNG